MENIQHRLTFFKTLLETYKIESVSKQLEELKAKSSDETLFLAVIGEFNSGKSTSINALLGRRILKEAVLPTTACATYIVRGRGEIEIGAVVGNESFHVTESHPERLNAYINKHYGIKISTIQHLIDTLTSEQSVARNVKALMLSIPDINLPDNIVIIDTPGFNPGEQSVDNHFEVTKEVVEKHADAALVLMPSDQPFSNSLRTFLQNYLHKYIHRCLFVVTKCDQKTKEERGMIYNFVCNRLKADFKLLGAKVFCESAITTLPVKKIPESMKEEWSYWQSEFSKFKKEIWQRLEKQRKIILSEHLYNLMLDLSAEMHNRLNEKQEELRKQKEKIDRSRVEHIETITKESSRRAKQNIALLVNKAKEVLEKEICSKKSDCMTYSGSRLTMRNLSNFATQVEPEIREDARKRASQALTSVNNYILRTVKCGVEEEIGKMKDDFTRHYSMFPSLHIEERRMSVDVKSISLPNMQFDGTNHIVTEMNRKGGDSITGGAVGGAVAGAAIGSVIPVIGTTLGLIGGGIVGFFMGGRKSDKIEENTYSSIKSSMENEINNYFNAVKKKINDKLRDRKRQIDRAFDAYSEKHITTYGETVNELIQQQERDSKAVQSNIERLKADLRSVEDIELQTKYDLSRLNVQN